MKSGINKSKWTIKILLVIAKCFKATGPALSVAPVSPSYHLNQMVPLRCTAVTVTGKNVKVVKIIKALANEKCIRATGHARLAKLLLPNCHSSQKTIQVSYAKIAIEHKKINRLIIVYIIKNSAKLRGFLFLINKIIFYIY